MRPALGNGRGAALVRRMLVTAESSAALEVCVGEGLSRRVVHAGEGVRAHAPCGSAVPPRAETAETCNVWRSASQEPVCSPGPLLHTEACMSGVERGVR